MAPTTILRENPFISIDNETICLFINGKAHQFATDNIFRMSIRKAKPGYFAAAIGKMLFIPDTGYNLHIKTADGKESAIAINRLERFYCIRLISHWRSNFQKGKA